MIIIEFNNHRELAERRLLEPPLDKGWAMACAGIAIDALGAGAPLVAGVDKKVSDDIRTGLWKEGLKASCTPIGAGRIEVEIYDASEAVLPERLVLIYPAWFLFCKVFPGSGISVAEKRACPTIEQELRSRGVSGRVYALPTSNKHVAWSWFSAVVALALAVWLAAHFLHDRADPKSNPTAATPSASTPPTPTPTTTPAPTPMEPRTGAAKTKPKRGTKEAVTANLEPTTGATGQGYSAQRERPTSMRVLPLLVEAEKARDARDFARAGRYYREILELEPGNRAAQLGLSELGPRPQPMRASGRSTSIGVEEELDDLDREGHEAVQGWR